MKIDSRRRLQSKPVGEPVQFLESEHLLLCKNRNGLLLNPWQRVTRMIGARWRTDCFVQGMANLTLAPEDDNPDIRDSSTFGLSAIVSDDSDQRTELERLRFRFNPHKVGFGILPWPGTDQPRQVKDTVVIAMNYLADGPASRDQGGKK